MTFQPPGITIPEPIPEHTDKQKTKRKIKTNPKAASGTKSAEFFYFSPNTSSSSEASSQKLLFVTNHAMNANELLKLSRKYFATYGISVEFFNINTFLW